LRIPASCQKLRYTNDPKASLSTYAQRLQPGSLFSQNRYQQTRIELAEQIDGVISVVVNSVNPDQVKPYGVTKITQEDHRFIHEAMGSFFELEGAKAKHSNILGRPYEYHGIDED
jgi:hypothetical protein